MPGNYYSESEGIAAGLYDPPGSVGARNTAAEVSRITGRGTPSDLFTGPLAGAIPFEGPMQGSTGNSATSGPTPLRPSTWRLPSISNVLTGMLNGPGANPNGTPAAGSWREWVEAFAPRIIIVVLGLVFVAAGLYMFRGGSPTTVAVSLAKGKGT